MAKSTLLLGSLLLSIAPLTRAQNTISTIAGGGGVESGLATSMTLPFPLAVARDNNGNIFILSGSTAALYKLDAQGQLTVMTGNGVQVSSGDGGPAAQATFNLPVAIAVDSHGDVLIADEAQSAVRKLYVSAGVVLTIAGTGNDGYGGDNGPANQAQLSSPQGVAVDGTGNVYISDTSNSRIRRVDAVSGVITTIAGNGTAGFSGDNGPATAALLNVPSGIAVDGAGNIFFVDAGNFRIRRIDAKTGIITTYAGNGLATYGGDGGPAINASFSFIGYGVPAQLAFDAAGNLYVADQFNERIRQINAATGIISTVAGGAFGPGGNGGPALAAQFSGPSGIAFDASGNLIIADNGNDQVRIVNAATSVITALAGNGSLGDAGPATRAILHFPQGVAVDANANVLIADSNDTVIRSVSPNGTISTVAGYKYFFSYSGDGGPGTAAWLDYPIAVTLDHASNIFIADANNNRIRRVDAQTGFITTVAGTGAYGFAGDSGPASSAILAFPSAVAFDANGNLFITDSGNQRIRRVDAVTGVITTVAGNGATGFSGDGSAATSASLNLSAPYGGKGGLAIDVRGNLYFSDSTNQRIRRVDALTGVITTVAGSGVSCGALGDGGQATSASFCFPEGLAIDTAGNLFIADLNNARVRRVDTISGTIATVVGNGGINLSPDGLPATQTSMLTPRDVAFDSAGNLYVVSANFQRVFRVRFTPSLNISGSIQNFGLQGAGLTSSPQTIVLSNQGGASLLISSISVTGNFAATNTCANNQIAPMTSCTVSVTFKPPTAGLMAGTLTIVTNDPANPTANVLLAGTGVIGGAGNLPVQGLSFGGQLIGGSTLPQAVTLINTGTSALAISNITIGGANPTEFMQSSQCPASLGTGASCVIQVSFTPLAPGTRSASLVVVDNQGGVVGTQQSVPLDGTGIAQSTTSLISVGFNFPVFYTTAPLISGPEPAATAANPLFAAANVWNNLTTVGGSGTLATNPSWPNLVNSSGSRTNVTFSITGSVIGVNLYGYGGHPDPLRQEYLAFNSSTLPGESSSISWQLSGLVANATYDMCLYGTRVDVARSFNMTIGDITQNIPSLLATVAQPPTCVYFGGLLADANGMITGTGTGIGVPLGYVNEANWAGFQIVQVPTTGTATASVPLSFTPGTNVSQVATLNCPSGTVPCTDPNAHSFKLTVGQVIAPFTLTVTAYEVPLSEANGICEQGQTETTDFDCRLTTFGGQVLPNGDTVVPQCIPYSNGNCVFYRISNVPPGSSYQGTITEYIAWNNSAYLPPPNYQGNNPRLYYDPDYAPYDVNHQFVFDITDYYVSAGMQVGTDPGIGGTTKHFSDFVVAFPPNPNTTYAFTWFPPLKMGKPTYFEQGNTIPVRFHVSPNVPAGVLTQVPNRTGYAVLLDTKGTACSDFTGVRQPTAVLPHGSTDISYDPVRQLYQLNLLGTFKPGRYKLLVTSNLMPEQCSAFVVTKD